MVNQVTLIGNLGDEVKLHYFEGGGCVGRFPVATSRKWKDNQGQEQSKTNWHNVVVRNKVAENCEKYLSKGSKVFVFGSIEYTQWQGEDGQTKYGTEISARSVQFLDSKGSGQGSSQRPLEDMHAGDEFLAGNPDKAQPAKSDSPDEDDDLPF